MPPKIPTESSKNPVQLPNAAQRKAQRKATRTPPPDWKDPLAQQQPLVSGRWLLYALLAVLGSAAAFSYLTLCLLFYQGQWQVVFHPSRTITATPALVGLKFDDVRFDYTGTGIPQLAGWWIPAQTNAPHADRTILFLHDSHGSLSDTVQELKTLHSLGVNIFAFDYRGFGVSANDHPSESRVYEDADAAWTYLTDIRHVQAKSLVLYGAGLGATIAAEVTIRHPESPALILENPAPPALSLILADSRTHLLPIKWLFRDRFEMWPKLQTLGIELPQPTGDAVKSGKILPSLEFVRVNRAEKGTRRLLVLGPNPMTDPHYIPALNDFLATP
jgi:pimeloyl-ACP methyl ester carboxylesterase